MNYWGLKRWKSDTHAHTYTRTHTHTSGCQLKIKFLDVLDYSEYSDTNISKKKFSPKDSFLNEEAKFRLDSRKFLFVIFLNPVSIECFN